MRIVFLMLIILMSTFCFCMENPEVSNAGSATSDSSSLSAQSWTSFDNLPPQPLAPTPSLGDLPPTVETNNNALETLPFRQMTIGGDGDSLRSSDGSNMIVSGNIEEQFSLEHTKEAKQATLSPDEGYIACYSQDLTKGSWVDIAHKSDVVVNTYNYPLPLGQFVDMKWKNSQLIIATLNKIHILSVYPQGSQLKVVPSVFSISKTGKEVKCLAIINACCWVLLKEHKAAACLYQIFNKRVNKLEKTRIYRLKEGDKESVFFMDSPKQNVSNWSIASPKYLWRFSTDKNKEQDLAPRLSFPHDVYAFITIALKPSEVICCAHSNKEFSFWDVEEGVLLKNMPQFDVKDFGKVTKMSVYNQKLYISDEKQTIEYPTQKLLRAAFPRLSIT